MNCKRCAEKDRDDERGHVGQDLQDDDVSAPLASYARRFEKLAVPQRERLGAQLPGAVGPARDGDHADQHQQPSVVEVRADDDHQRQGREDEEDVGEEVEGVVPQPAEIRRRHADDHGYGRRGQAGGERDEQRLPGAEDELGEDVLSDPGRAEEVSPRRLQHLVECQSAGVVRSYERRKDRDQDEEAEDGQAGERLAIAHQRAGQGARRPLAADDHGGRERRGPLEVGKGCQLNQRSLLACDETDLVEVAVDRGDPLPHHPEQPHLLTRGDELEALDVEGERAHLVAVVATAGRAVGSGEDGHRVGTAAVSIIGTEPRQMLLNAA